MGPAKISKVVKFKLIILTRGVLAQSLEPEAQDKVLDNNPDLEMLVLEKKGKPEYQEQNLSEPRKRTKNKFNPYMTPSLGIEPGPHWSHHCAIPAVTQNQI